MSWVTTGQAGMGFKGAESLGKLELITWQNDDLVDLGLCPSILITNLSRWRFMVELW